MNHLREPNLKVNTASKNRRLIWEELETLRSEIRAGEPPPEAITFRSRIGLFLKHRLYRLLWWHTRQLNAVVDLMSRWIAEEGRSIDELQETLQNFESKQSADSLRLLEQVSKLAQHVQSESSQREHATASLSRAAQNTEAEVQRLSVLAENIGPEVERLGPEVQRLSGIAQNLEAEIQRLSGVAQNLEAQTRQDLSALTQRTEAETKQVSNRLSSLGLLTNQTRESLSIQDRRLTLFIEEARKRLPEPLAREDLMRMVDDHSQHKYDSIYAAFEDVFRGSREEIKARQTVYIPILKEHSIGSPSMPLLDLGCGRGEWLEVLNENGLQARGIDSNEAMIERCRSFGLQAELADSMTTLGSLPDGSIGAVTAFHMVEHMPFDVVLKLVDQALRVLKPGGLLILETPNPANLWVGTYTFHLDPTHLKPLPSPMLRFFVEGRGFCDVNIRDLHPYPEAVQFPDDQGGIASRFNNYLYGPQDYAIIGRKP